ncbi:MAG: DUF4097 domain-containing protein [Eubacterium sp.]|nr:DUF4097 domain-containing protein [Eubacterium sp.]
MKKGLLLIIGLLISLFLIGGILIIIGLAGGGSLNFSVDYRDKKVEAEKEKSIIQDEIRLDEFDAVDIDVDMAKVRIVNGDSYKVSYRLYDSSKPIVKVNDNKVLEVKHEINNGLQFNIGDLFDSGKGKAEYYVEISLPEGKKLGESSLDVDAGEIVIDGFDFETLSAECNAGNIDLSNSNMDELTLNVDAGNISISDGTIKKIKIDENAGNVTIDKVEAENAELSIDMGNLDADNFHLDKLIADINAGNATFKEFKFTGLEVMLDAGDLDMDVIGEEADYSFDSEIDAGNLKINGDKKSEKYSTEVNGDGYIKLDIDAGNANISFK